MHDSPETRKPHTNNPLYYLLHMSHLRNSQEIPRGFPNSDIIHSDHHPA
ncbi:Unannotated [Lentimonas sp. CC19]|nr:Unannotated [Lentimonas sp. CC4]CAA6687463.1 Unannotated [Lentimonas sp. CC6]CAA6697550.1 Unannotated [Lentimonas sp. CC19]CAA6697792.1 Unannotated [Lentimonas sp. CC10]CAA7071475.1 Unannotated [Lentimonas sp. CC11]CAA7172121.1 Unannotated [Lentimonas sp. CC21]CAA7181805.1 Unannotated [Lentimonas sp. CC8]